MNKNTFSNRVTWYNFILCIFVVWIHAQNTDLFTEVVMIEGKPLFNQIEQTMVSDIAVVGVAGFFLCSGYLFYRNYSWGKVLEKYKTRFVGLLIPYVIWTLLYYFIHVGVSYITPLRAVFNEPPITVTWKGIVDAVLNYRYCAFLWFLQFLILLVVLSPLIYLLISNKYMGIVAIGLVLAAGVSERLGLAPAGLAVGLAEDLKKVGLPTQSPIAIGVLLEALEKDKKVEGDAIHFILPRAVGEVVDRAIPLKQLEEVARDLR